VPESLEAPRRTMPNQLRRHARERDQAAREFLHRDHGRQG
jgi:hypothetical protein